MLPIQGEIVVEPALRRDPGYTVSSSTVKLARKLTAHSAAPTSAASEAAIATVRRARREAALVSTAVRETAARNPTTGADQTM